MGVVQRHHAGDDLGAVSAAVQSALGEVDVPDEVSVDTGGASSANPGISR